jgi:diaminohydroxyphosphoribosylaminopyrimidine deaminase/5-amino-6-(5-phosphoribosylamino)uracil reductase
MRRAIELAARAFGTTSPNPAVGCVVLDSELAVAGEGFTSPPGGPHAEVNALQEAGARARGGTAVVTLEPCNHYGRTPPCTLALVAAGVSRVVFAVTDPDPAAAGGAEALRRAGLEVEGGILVDEAAAGLEAWLGSVELRRPFVTWAYGASLDGRVGAARGEAPPFNSPEALADLRYRLRRESDLLVVGAGGKAPDAYEGREDGRPGVLVLDTEAKTPSAAPVFSGPAPVLVAVAQDVDSSWLEGRAEVLPLPRSGEQARLDLGALMKALFEREVRALLLEDEPALSGSFLAAGLIDRVIAYVAPTLIGDGGIPALGGPGAPTIDAAWRFRIDELVQLGTDVRVTARPERPVSAAADSGRRRR